MKLSKGQKNELIKLGVRVLYLHGSMADGTARGNSDVDLGVLLDKRVVNENRMNYHAFALRYAATSMRWIPRSLSPSTFVHEGVLVDHAPVIYVRKQVESPPQRQSVFVTPIPVRVLFDRQHFDLVVKLHYNSGRCMREFTNLELLARSLPADAAGRDFPSLHPLRPAYAGANEIWMSFGGLLTCHSLLNHLKGKPEFEKNGKDWWHAQFIFSTIGIILVETHEKAKLVNCDVKPSNIIIPEEMNEFGRFQPCLIDWDVAVAQGSRIVGFSDYFASRRLREVLTSTRRVEDVYELTAEYLDDFESLYVTVAFLFFDRVPGGEPVKKATLMEGNFDGLDILKVTESAAAVRSFMTEFVGLFRAPVYSEDSFFNFFKKRLDEANNNLHP